MSSSRIKFSTDVDRALLREVRDKLETIGAPGVSLRGLVEQGLRASLPMLDNLIAEKQRQEGAGLLRRLERRMKTTNPTQQGTAV